MKLKGEVHDLSGQLQSALDHIHNLFVDLATTRSLLDAQMRRQQNNGGASTSKGQTRPIWWSMLQGKGKKTPSIADSKKAPSRGPSLS